MDISVAIRSSFYVPFIKNIAINMALGKYNLLNPTDPQSKQFKKINKIKTLLLVKDIP